MNNSAPTPPSGPNSTTPNAGGALPPRGRKRPASSAFIQRKPPPKKVAPSSRPGPASTAGANGIRGPVPVQRPGSSGQQVPNGVSNAVTTPASTSQQRPPDNVFSVRISKSDIEQGMRYHGFKFSVKPDKTRQTPQLIDPYNPQDFTRPLRLHRRYAHDKQDTGDQSDAPPGIDDKERELFNAKRAERQAEREFNQAQIAPTGNPSKKPQPKKKNEKIVQDVWYDENNPRQKKASQLRYEETKPWHLEDDDNKNTWIGSYQEPLSETSVLFTIDSDAGFTMTPVERWYRFQQTNRLAAMTSEQAEKVLQAKAAPSRWFLNTHVGQQEAKASAVKQQREKALAAKRAAEDDSAYRKVKNEGEFYNEDVDVLDLEFQDEEFQDDDEGVLVVGENQEETDEIERRIRQEMRGAGVSAPGLKDNEDIDNEEAQAKAESREQRRREKKIKKQLIKKEKQYHYESDSDSSDPYGESDDSTDSEEEREREEAERKEEEAKKLAQANGDKSGASTKGTNTPSGRPEKKDLARVNGASLKRPGSPNLSDVSGNESRKKPKVGQGSLSPNHRGYGSGSETESSRAGRPSHNKIRLTSRPGSPASGTPMGSRAQSPAPRTGTPPNSMPTKEQVRDAIPPGGIAIAELVQKFRSRVAGKENMNVFIALVRDAGQQDPVTKLIVPKAPKEGDA